MHENYKYNLETKKNNVKNGIIKYNPKESIIQRYIFLLKLLIQDNTNKTLLKHYIQLLKENNDDLKNIYKDEYEDFQSEFNYYKAAFEPTETIQHFSEEKISEKEEFFDLLKKIKDTKAEEENKMKQKFNNLVDEFKSYNLGRFNQRIEFDNQELYWFRNKALLIYALLEMDFDSFKLMIYCIEKIIDKKLFENKIILNNYKLITLIIILLVSPLEEDYFYYNINLIESMIQKKKQSLPPDALKILNKANKYRLTEYEEAYHMYSKIINLDNIKNFLQNIFLSNVFKEAFQILYPSYINYPFENKIEAENYINKHINFVVFNSSKVNGVTDKLTMETYIFLEPKKIKIKTNAQKQQDELVEKILYSSAIIKTNFHEFNHNLYNILYFHENGSIPLDTPRRGDGSEKEGGIDLELLLFGKKINTLSLKEALYILNEENYNKNIFQFKEDFKKLYFPNENKEDYKIKGVFHQYTIPDKILNEKKIQFILNLNLNQIFLLLVYMIIMMFLKEEFILKKILNN